MDYQFYRPKQIYTIQIPVIYIINIKINTHKNQKKGENRENKNLLIIAILEQFLNQETHTEENH